jgi:hypothetical protein
MDLLRVHLLLHGPELVISHYREDCIDSRHTLILVLGPKGVDLPPCDGHISALLGVVQEPLVVFGNGFGAGAGCFCTSTASALSCYKAFPLNTLSKFTL